MPGELGSMIRSSCVATIFPPRTSQPIKLYEFPNVFCVAESTGKILLFFSRLPVFDLSINNGEPLISPQFSGKIPSV